MLRNLIRSKKTVELLSSSLSVHSSSVYYSNENKRNEHLSKKTIDPFDENPDPFKTVPFRELKDDPPVRRTLRIIKRDLVIAKRRFASLWKGRQTFDSDDYSEYSPNIFPKECDVIIVGGGAMGSSIAYWLKQRIPKGLSIMVVEKDPTYRTASTALSVGGLRQQFSFEENIQMSLFGAEFLRNINEYLGIEGEPPVNVQFHPYGYLFLATEKGAQTLTENSKLQVSLGARNTLLSPIQLKNKFPWLNVDKVALGCLGLEKEGWFDPWALLCGFKRKAIDLGVEYVTAEAKDIAFDDNSNFIDEYTGHAMHEKLDRLIVQTKDGKHRSIKFAIIIVACGAFSAKIAQMARIGSGDGILSIPLPVEPRKRYVYCFHAPEGPGLNTPLTIDSSGTYFRREGLGGLYVCGRQPEPHEEPSIDNLDVDDNFFHKKIWPILANRVPAFENLKLKSSWAGFYEYNTYDANGIVGVHPYYRNMLFATGFTGHGIQHSPAVGRAVMELITHSRYMTINLSRLGFDRFITSEPMTEATIL